MESPLLIKSEHSVDDVTIHGDSSSNDEHIVDITTNGDSSSADEETPHAAFQWSDPFTNGRVWILVEFVATLVQIVAAIFFLTLTKDEQHPELELPLFVWIISYTCASIATFPIVCWRLWHYNQNVSSETSISEVMDGLERFLESFFVCLVVVFLWYFCTEIVSRDDDTTQHFWLWLALLAFSCVRYVLPDLQCAVGCFVWPVLFLLKQLLEGITTMIKALVTFFWLIIAIFVSIIGIFVSICE